MKDKSEKVIIPIPPELLETVRKIADEFGIKQNSAFKMILKQGIKRMKENDGIKINLGD